MDRRQTRRDVMRQIGFMEETRDKLLSIEADADGAGEVVLASELRRYIEKLTDTLDKLYVWAGNI